MVRLVGLLLILVGLGLSYLGWRESNRISDIEDQADWEDAVYGPGGEAGGVFLGFGALIIFVGLIMALKIF